MFSKILIANRGEIAVRILRACRDLGIPSVAVFSDVDRRSLHVRLANEAYWIGDAEPSQSYLNQDRLIQVAHEAQADALHPGYGFLAENPAFARRCREEDIVFIGPSPETMEAVGEKTRARRLMSQQRVPIIPGSLEPLQSLKEVRKAAKHLCFPILLKAVAGGGGKGMRVVESSHELESAYRTAASEAKSAFGNPSVYLEQYLERPRHIEFQILGDRSGRIVHFGERECSIQRRHQKLIEEAPSPALTDELRTKMEKVALRAAQAASYEGAGTVEFLLDQSGQFYFLEINARLQVEHPVTEMITGHDLVKLQLQMAAGKKLSLAQQDIRPNGHALECRIFAEDPYQDFLPSPGKVAALRVPEGPGVRHDSGIYPGWEVPATYDPILAKLIVWGLDRDEAIQRMRRALSEYEISGIKTTIPFLRKVMDDESFQKGQIDTNYISRIELARVRGAEKVAAIATALSLYLERLSDKEPTERGASWGASTPRERFPNEAWESGKRWTLE